MQTLCARVLQVIWILGAFLQIGCQVDEPSGLEGFEKNLPQETQLRVQELKAEPLIVSAGTPVKITAVIVNEGELPIYALQLVVAVGRIGAADGEWEMHENFPTEPIARLVPGEMIHFQGEAQALSGDGWFLVGVAGTANNAILPPQGQKVRLVHSSSTLSDTLWLLLFYLIVFGLAGIILNALFGRATSEKLFVPQRKRIIVGISGMIVGVLWFASIKFYAPHIEPSALMWLPLIGVALFAAGWIVCGAGLAPRNRARNGIVLAAAAYLLIGIVWVVVFNTGLNLPLYQVISQPDFLFIALIWPLQISQLLGIFGLGFE